MTLKIDCQLRDLDFTDVGAHAVRMQKMGFDAAWTFEAAQDAFTPLILAAAATDDIHLGTNIAVAFGRSPFAMAQQAWDVQKLSRGRLHLGLGTQVRAHVERRFSMPFEHPARRISDYVRCVKAIFDTFQNDARPDYRGEFYQFTLMNPFFNPGPVEHPEIPVYLAGVNPRMCRAAGEVADGFHNHPIHTVGYIRDVVKPAIDEGARSRGLGVDDLEIQTMVLVAVGDSQAELDERIEDVRMQIAFYGSTPNYRGVLEHMGRGELGKELSALMRRGELAEMKKRIPDAMIDEIAIIGKLSEAGAKIRARYQGVLDRVAWYYPIPQHGDLAAWRAVTDAVRAAP